MLLTRKRKEDCTGRINAGASHARDSATLTIVKEFVMSYKLRALNDVGRIEKAISANFVLCVHREIESRWMNSLWINSWMHCCVYTIVSFHYGLYPGRCTVEMLLYQSKSGKHCFPRDDKEGNLNTIVEFLFVFPMATDFLKFTIQRHKYKWRSKWIKQTFSLLWARYSAKGWRIRDEESVSLWNLSVGLCDETTRLCINQV